MPEPKKEHPPHVLDDLLSRVAKSNPKILEGLLEGTSNEDLIAEGASIATARIVTDGVRLYGQASDFLEGASPGQKKQLRGFSPALLAAAVHHLDALRKLESETADTSKDHATSRLVVDEEVRGIVVAAIALRDQAFDALSAGAGGNTKLITEVEEAFGVADPPEKLAKGLEAMSKLLTRWLASKDGGLGTRLEVASLDKTYATELSEMAHAVRTSTAAAAKRTSPRAMQAALDREDGVQILLLGQIIRAFEGAHGRDATIPRLVPISTRRLFRRSGKKKAEAPEEPTEPTDS